MKYLILLLFITSNAYGNSNKQFIQQLEVKYNIPEGLLSAMAFVESSFNEKAHVKKDGKSGKASYGLFQIQLDTALFIQKLMAKEYKYKITKDNRITAKRLMIPEVNSNYAAYYIKWILKQKKNDFAWSLSCYNAGINSYICKNKKYSPYVGLVLNAYLNQL